MVDLAAILTETLSVDDVRQATESVLLTFAEGMFNVLANELAVRQNRSTSQLEAASEIERDPRWQHCLDILNGL